MGINNYKCQTNKKWPKKLVPERRPLEVENLWPIKKMKPTAFLVRKLTDGT